MNSTKPQKVKTLKELTLLDKFLFDETMDHPDVHEASEEMGVKYMQKWEEKLFDREEGKEEGIKEATLICLQNLMANLQIPMEEALPILGVPKENWEEYLQQNQ